MKNAAAALVKNAETAAPPATTPHSGVVSAQRVEHAQLMTMNAVIVDSMSAARFHMTET